MIHFFLIGFMGSGKTSLGKKIAANSQTPFVDLDRHIANKENQTVHAIFKNQGEQSFRVLERKYLEELVKNAPVSTLFALGGGTPCFFDTLQFLKENGRVIYLKASVEKLHSVLKYDNGKRPLLQGVDDLSDFIRTALNQREAFYLQADHHVLTDGKKTEEVVEEVSRIIAEEA